MSEINLGDLRQQIDVLDEKWITILAERFRVTHEVGVYKATQGIDPIDPQRESAQMEKIAMLAEENGLAPDLAKGILRLIIDAVVSNHQEIAASLSNPDNS